MPRRLLPLPPAWLAATSNARQGFLEVLHGLRDHATLGKRQQVIADRVKVVHDSRSFDRADSLQLLGFGPDQRARRDHIHRPTQDGQRDQGDSQDRQEQPIGEGCPEELLRALPPRWSCFTHRLSTHRLPSTY